MQKIKRLMIEIPKRVGCLDRNIMDSVSRLGSVLYDYELNNSGVAFPRISNKAEDCEKRLLPYFASLERMVDFGADQNAIDEGKKLLLLASTSDLDEQSKILLSYPEESQTYSDVMTTDQASQIGVQVFWSE